MFWTENHAFATTIITMFNKSNTDRFDPSTANKHEKNNKTAACLTRTKHKELTLWRNILLTSQRPR